MLLKKDEKNGIVKGFYDSSNILMSEYSKNDNGLTIVFKGGGKYLYKGVTFRDFTRFEIADSQGIVLNKHIKNKYGFDNLGKIDTKFITEEIKTINEETLKELGSTLITKMKALIKENNEQGTISKTLLNSLKTDINTYETKRDGKTK
jgi:hypothetical protein